MNKSPGWRPLVFKKIFPLMNKAKDSYQDVGKKHPCFKKSWNRFKATRHLDTLLFTHKQFI